MKRRKRVAMIVLLWLFWGLSAAAEDKETEVQTEIRSGGVRIRMTQYSDTEEKSSREEKGGILPGQEIPMVTIVENLGEDCYVRYRLTGEAKSGQKIPDTCFQGMTETDVKKESYFYVKEKLEHGEKRQILSAFQLPESWTEKEDAITIRIVVDAIQSRNFTPDFGDTHPWGETEIQKVSEDDADHQLRVCVPQRGVCQVVLEGEKILTVPDSFFSEMETMLPGDVVEGEFRIENHYETPEALYWKLDTEDKTLLERMELQIAKEDGTILFQGTFQEFPEGEYQLLGHYQQQERDRLFFTVHFPKDSDNAYRMLQSRMTWTFRAVSEEQETVGAERVKTGENSPLAFLVVWVCSLTFIVTLRFLHKQKKYE